MRWCKEGGPSGAAACAVALALAIMVVSPSPTGADDEPDPCARGETDLKRNGTCTSCEKGTYTIRGHTGACTPCSEGETDDDRDPSTACVTCGKVQNPSFSVFPCPKCPAPAFSNFFFSSPFSASPSSLTSTMRMLVASAISTPARLPASRSQHLRPSHSCCLRSFYIT